jgi:dUTP pyrophosphatase
MEIEVVRLSPVATLPVYAHEGDAGCDLIAAEEAVLAPAGGRALVGTGIAIAVPEGHGAFVLPRSGLSTKHGVTCINAPGLIDAGYRGEVRVSLINHDPTDEYHVKIGDRIAQLVVLPVPSLTFRVVEQLSPATRGADGFGSTGR